MACRPWFDKSHIRYSAEMQIHELKAYACSEAVPSYYPPDQEIRHMLVGCLIKDGLTESFKPVIDAEYELSIDVPATWFDHLKTHLPEDLKFGWLAPKFETKRKFIDAPVTININKYRVVVNEDKGNVYRSIVSPSEDFDIREFDLIRPLDRKPKKR